MVGLRQRADQIAEIDDENPEPRPHVMELVDGGIDSQLEMALLILKARVLADLDRAGEPAIAARGG